MPDGHVNKCKECNKADVRRNYDDKKEFYHTYDKERQRASRTRIFNHRYTQIKQRVDGRATRSYKIEGSKMLTPEEYALWLKSNMDEFEAIYQQWAASNFKRNLTPSIDRINNKLGYIPKNMRWATVRDNSVKGSK